MHEQANRTGFSGEPDLLVEEAMEDLDVAELQELRPGQRRKRESGFDSRRRVRPPSARPPCCGTFCTSRPAQTPPSAARANCDSICSERAMGVERVRHRGAFERHEALVES